MPISKLYALTLSLYIYTVYGSNNSSVTDVCLFDYQLSMSGGEMMGMILETLPVGFRFYPTDQLLVDHFLGLKIRGMDSDLKLKIVISG